MQLLSKNLNLKESHGFYLLNVYMSLTISDLFFFIFLYVAFVCNVFTMGYLINCKDVVSVYFVLFCV